MSKETTHQGISRRGFLKTTAAIVGATAGYGSTFALAEAQHSAQPTKAEENVYVGVCRPNCGMCCTLNVHVRDNKIVKTSMHHLPDETASRICLRGLAHPARIYDPARVKYPIRRAEGTLRGEGRWERISWDEAIDEIATKWTQLQAQYGPSAVAYWAISGGYGIWTTSHPIYMRLNNLLNGSRVTACVDMANAIGTNRVLGWEAVWSTNDARDLKNAKNIFLWSDNFTESQIQEWRFLADAIESGSHVITIDPTFTTVASKSNRWISIRPGSDAILTLSMIQVIIEEELYDTGFMQAHTVAPFLVRKDNGLFLRSSDFERAEESEEQSDGSFTPTVFDVTKQGQFDNSGTTANVDFLVWDCASDSIQLLAQAKDPAISGHFVVNGLECTTAFDLLKEEASKWTPEVAAKECEVDANVIRELARLCVDGPVTHRMGWGSQSYVNGVHPAHALAALVSLTGQIGFPGASCGGADWNGASWSQSWASGAGVSSSPTVPVLCLPDVMQSGEFAGKECRIKSALIHHANPLCTVVDANKFKSDVLDKMEFIITVDSAMTDTACYSDLVLPVAQWFEFEEITTGGQTNFTVGFNEKAIDPPYEAKTDSEIGRLIAAKLNLEEYFADSDEAILRGALESAQMKSLGITFERLKKEKTIPWRSEIKIAYKGQKFPTSTGRMEFYVEKPTPFNNYGQAYDAEREHLPRFFEPGEAWPTNPKHEKYPFVLMTSRNKYMVHGQWFSNPILRELDPEPFFRINPQDAKQYGIEDGSHAEVYNDRGHCVAKAVYSEAIRPGTLAYAKNTAKSSHISGSWAELLSFEFDPIAVNQCFMDALVGIRPWKEAE